MPDGSTAFMIERMNNREWQTIEDCWCVDAGVQTELVTPDAILCLVDFRPRPLLGQRAGIRRWECRADHPFRRRVGAVTTFTDSEHVSGTWLQPCIETYANDPLNRPLPQLPGNWTIAGLVSEVAGLQHLAGDNVVGLADGVPIGLDPALQATFPSLPPQSFGFLVPEFVGPTHVAVPGQSSNARTWVHAPTAKCLPERGTAITAGAAQDDLCRDCARNSLGNVRGRGQSD